MEISTSPLPVHLVEKLSPAAQALVKTLLYFDIFQYPLNQSELLEYCQEYPMNKEELEQELSTLRNKECIEQEGDFYFIPGSKSSVVRRKRGNAEAEKKMKIAQNISQFIAIFPFVQSISISGSLSKNYMDKNSDIDFFIITKPHRLWLCRGLLVLFKKFFLLNSRKHFCINYYLDSENLEIPDHNIFTATEIVFLKPTYNAELFHQFAEKNNWCNLYYPNKRNSSYAFLPTKSKQGKLLFEKVLAGKLGEKLDTFFFKLTLRRWKKKFPHFNTEEFDLNLRSRKNVSKHHPRGYQKIVLESFQKKKVEFEMHYNVKLT